MAVTKKARRNAYIALYKVVAKYVKLQGGKVIITEGIQVQEWPDKGKMRFTIAVKCMGTKPAFAKEAPDGK